MASLETVARPNGASHVLVDPGSDEASATARAVEPSAWERFVHATDAEWFTRAPDPRKWLLRDGRRDRSPGLLPLGKAGMLVAEGGAGKTMLLCQLAIAVATGTPFLGCFPVATAGRVLLALSEEDRDEAHRRLYNAARTGAPTPADGSIVVLALASVPCTMLESDERGNMQDTAFAHWLFAFVDAEAAAGRPFALVVLDPLSRYAGRDAEKDNAAATRFCQSVERLTSPETTALVSHHNNKVSRGGRDVATADARGATAFGDGFRWVATLSPLDIRKALESPEEQERLGNAAALAFTKSNYGRKGDPIQLRRDPDLNGVLVPLDEVDRERVELARTKNPDRSARTAAREDERESRTRARDEEDDAAARAALEGDPAGTVRHLCALVMKARACGSERARAAVSRARRAT